MLQELITTQTSDCVIVFIS